MGNILIDRVACRKVCAECPYSIGIQDRGLVRAGERTKRVDQCRHFLSRLMVAEVLDRGSDAVLNPYDLSEAIDPGPNRSGKPSSTTVYPDISGSFVGIPSGISSLEDLDGFNILELAAPEAVSEEHFK